MLDRIASCHCIQFQGNLINQTLENDKKPSFGPDFGTFGLIFFQKSGSVSHYIL